MFYRTQSVAKQSPRGAGLWHQWGSPEAKCWRSVLHALPESTILHALLQTPFLLPSEVQRNISFTTWSSQNKILMLNKVLLPIDRRLRCTSLRRSSYSITNERKDQNERYRGCSFAAFDNNISSMIIFVYLLSIVCWVFRFIILIGFFIAV